MKTSPSNSRSANAGFTLIEMIGILAIMMILAGIMTPNALQSIERAAVRAEADNLRNLGQAVGLYVRDNNGTLPTEGPGNWNTQLATYSSLAQQDILTNRRQMARLYVIDPTAANQRAMLISSMRTGIALPTLAQARAGFSGIWTWPLLPNTIPPGGGWNAWGAGPSPALDNIEYLVIERINLSPIFRNDLQTVTVTLNQIGAGTVSYRVVPAVGAAQFGTLTAATPTSTVSLSLRPKDRVNLYSDAAGATLRYTYIVSTGSTGKTFDFTTAWAPQ